MALRMVFPSERKKYSASIIFKYKRTIKFAIRSILNTIEMKSYSHEYPAFLLTTCFCQFLKHVLLLAELNVLPSGLENTFVRKELSYSSHGELVIIYYRLN